MPVLVYYQHQWVKWGVRIKTEIDRSDVVGIDIGLDGGGAVDGVT